MKRLNFKTFITFSIVIIVACFIAYYLTISNVCADDQGPSCTPILPIPTTDYLPSVTPTEIPAPTITSTIVPTDAPAQPTVTPTPTAGASATVAMPTSAPDTGKAM